MAQTKTAAKSSKKPAAKKKAAASKTSKTAKPTKSAKKAAPKRKKAAPRKAGNQEVTVDRRRDADRREETAEAKPTEAPKLERREKVNRRRQIDPTTCERDYSDSEVEFMNALDNYKRRSGRMFPTCSEVLEVIREIGYVQLSPAELAAVREQRGESVDASVEERAEAEARGALADSDAVRVD